MLVVAPDIKPAPSAASDPVRMLHDLLRGAYSRGVPVVFALSRRSLGQVCLSTDVLTGRHGRQPGRHAVHDAMYRVPWQASMALGCMSC